MAEARGLDREELITRPKRRRAEGRKYAMVTRWDPQAPNVKEGMRQMEAVLYGNPENVTVFPPRLHHPGLHPRQEPRGDYRPDTAAEGEEAESGGRQLPLLRPQAVPAAQGPGPQPGRRPAEHHQPP